MRDSLRLECPELGLSVVYPGSFARGAPWARARLGNSVGKCGLEIPVGNSVAGVYRKHAADGASCPAAERYEGVLVRFERATLRGLADSFGRMEVFKVPQRPR